MLRTASPPPPGCLFLSFFLFCLVFLLFLSFFPIFVWSFLFLSLFLSLTKGTIAQDHQSTTTRMSFLIFFPLLSGIFTFITCLPFFLSFYFFTVFPILSGSFYFSCLVSLFCLIVLLFLPFFSILSGLFFS